jgi:hypothetical protein
LRQNAFAPKRLHSSQFNFLINLFCKDLFQGSWKHCRIYKLSKFPEKLFICYKINGSKGKPTSICIVGASGFAFGAYYPSIIHYVTENSDILFPVVKTPLRQNAFASPPLISFQFSQSMYFGRTHFRGLGNIVGFTNSPNSARNYLPVMNFIDRIAKAKGNGGKWQKPLRFV